MNPRIIEYQRWKPKELINRSTEITQRDFGRPDISTENFSRHDRSTEITQRHFGRPGRSTEIDNRSICIRVK